MRIGSQPGNQLWGMWDSVLKLSGNRFSNAGDGFSAVANQYSNCGIVRVGGIGGIAGIAWLAGIAGIVGIGGSSWD